MTNYTWNNINMKLLLGDMVNDCDDFTIALSSLAVGWGVNYGNNALDRLVDFTIEGLTFKHSSYNVLSKNNIQSATVFSYNFINIDQTVDFLYNINLDSNSIVFTNDRDSVNFNLYYTKQFGNGPVGTTKSFPHAVFTFKITGIPRTLAKNHELINLK